MSFHFKAQEDVNKFEKEVDNIYPGSICSKPKSLGQYRKLIKKTINPSVSTEELNLSLTQIINSKFYLRIFCFSTTANPCQIFA